MFGTNAVGPDGIYSITKYKNDTYLNGYNCSVNRCDMGGVDISGSDPDGVNKPGLLYFRNGGDIMIDASTLDLRKVTFNGKSLRDHLANYPKSGGITDSIPPMPSLSYNLEDINIESNIPPANSSNKLNLTQTNPFNTVPTVRTNPYNSDTTMNTPVTENLSNGTESGGVIPSIQGTNNFDTSNFDMNTSYNNIIQFWTNHIANNIIQYNPISIFQINTKCVYDNLFINLFNGNFQLNAYEFVYINYWSNNTRY
jgi:hypothetical protein